MAPDKLRDAALAMVRECIAGRLDWKARRAEKLAPLRLNSGRNVGIYAAKDRLIASGLIWPENQDLLVQKAFLMHQPVGQGHVIAFAEDANYRAFSEATMLLFMNAVLLGPSY